MVLDLEINVITQTERCIRSQNNEVPRFRRNNGVKYELERNVEACS